MSQSTAKILQARFSSLNRRVSSIEVMSLKKETKANNNTSIETTELPDEIKQLITGSDFWVKAKTNRYLKLWREGHGGILLRIAAEAKTKNNPANWFATTASKAMWERTLEYIKKLDEVAKQAAYVAYKLKTTITKFIYKQVWHQKNVIYWADLAADTPHTKPKQSPLRYFAWLCKEGERYYGFQTN